MLSGEKPTKRVRINIGSGPNESSIPQGGEFSIDNGINANDEESKVEN